MTPRPEEPSDPTPQAPPTGDGGRAPRGADTIDAWRDWYASLDLTPEQEAEILFSCEGPDLGTLLRYATVFVIQEEQPFLDEPNPAMHNIRIVKRRPNGWGVYEGPFSVGRDGRHSHEPIPSSRSDEWIAHHRFSFEEAWVIADEHRERYRAEMQRRWPDATFTWAEP